MTVRSFQGINSVVEVECSGESLAADVDILTMSLFASRARDFNAFVNLKTNECRTAGQFSSCRIDERNSRKTRLSTLVLDLKVDEVRWYICNITTLKEGRWVNVLLWSVEASRESKWRRGRVGGVRGVST